MANIVSGYGCGSADLMVIGEAPGAVEDKSGIPFSGPSGKLLDEALREAGHNPTLIYKTNVVKVRLPNNDLSKLKMLGYSIEDFQEELWKEVYDINPKCILAVGNTALEAITGHKGIKHYRGSILKAKKTGHKVVACLHPASLLHDSGGGSEALSWKEFTWIKFDVKRAVHQSSFREIRLPERDLHVARSSYDVYKFFNRYNGKHLVALDVETFKTFAQCVALAFSADEAISIPLFTDDIDQHDLSSIWKMIWEFLNDNNTQIIAQNAKFDEKRMRQIGLKWKNPCYFSLDMAWHILFPEFPKKLEFIASIITEEPYYKDEGKEFNPKIHKMDRWYLYNAKDAAVEFECAIKIIQELKDLDLYDYYFDKISPLYKVYYDMEDTGILVDPIIREKLSNQYEALRVKKQTQLASLISEGHQETFELYKDFNVMSNGPKNQVAKLLFGHLKIPVRKDTSQETLKSLANNTVKDTRKKEIIKLILEIRKVRKTIGTYINAKISNGEPWLI